MARQVLKKICEIGVDFSFAALSVFRLRRAEAASAVWIPHWHDRYRVGKGESVDLGGRRIINRIRENGNVGFRSLLGARRRRRGQFSVQSECEVFWQGGRGCGAPPGRGGELGCPPLRRCLKNL